MTMHILRRTLVRIAWARQLDASKLSQWPFFYYSLPSFSTLVRGPAKPSSEVTKYLMSRHQFSPESASAAASVLIHLENYRKSDLIIDYLKQTGLSNAQLQELLIRKPVVLIASLNRCIKPKVQRIKELGFSRSDVADMLSSVPSIFTISSTPSRLGDSILVLRSVLESNFHVVKLLKVCDWFLASDLDRTMVPNIELMKSCGISPIQIRQLLFSFPRFFLVKPEFLRDCVTRVDEMGLNRDSKMFIHGVRTVSSMSLEKWESKLKLLRSMGFTEQDILFVFRRTPQVLAISERKIKVTKLLLSLGNVDIPFVAQHPELLIYSATRRIKPRLEIIHILKSKELMSREPSITSICKMSDGNFIEKFLVPYASDIGESAGKYMASRGIVV